MQHAEHKGKHAEKDDKDNLHSRFPLGDSEYRN